MTRATDRLRIAYQASSSRGRSGTLCAAVVLGLLGALLVQADAAVANTPACPTTTSAAQKASPTLLAGCGERLAVQTSTIALPHGGREITYENPEGVTTSMAIPPSAFDAATATPAERKRYGIPSEPEPGTPAYVKWHQVVNEPLHFVAAPPALVEHTEPNRVFPKAGSAAAANPTSERTASAADEPANWSGYLNWEGEGNYSQATAYYKEPNAEVESGDCGYAANSATWAGVDGWYDLAGWFEQAGTYQNGVDQIKKNHEGFYEVFRPGERESASVGVENFIAPVGKWIESNVEYAGSEKWTIFLHVLGTTEATSFKIKGGLTGKTTEFVAERLVGQGLLDFGNLQIQGFTNNKDLAQWKTQRLEAGREGGGFDASPGGPIKGYEFIDRWEHCTQYKNETAEEKLTGGREGPAPTVSATAASEIGETTATVNGSVTPEGDYTDYHFEYGTEAGDYTASTEDTTAGEGHEAIKVDARVSGLAPGTTYHVRLLAYNANGQVTSEEVTLTTKGKAPPPPPTVTTEAASGVHARTATLEATVNPNGGETHYYFEYGTLNGLYEDTAPAAPGEDIGSEASPHHVATAISALTPDRTYYFRVVASNSTGTSYGAQRELKTRGWSPPQATVNPAGSPTTSVSLRGVSCSSGDACTAVGTYIDGEDAYVSLAERWNGTSWEVQTTPNPTGSVGSFLYAVSCHGAAECTAVGYYEKTSGGSHYPFAERWNGTTWAVETVPIPSKGENIELAAVSCGSSAQCLAVGSYRTGTPSKRKALAETWNGTAWKVDTTAKLPTEDEQASFEGVSCAEASQCAVVGVALGTSLGEVALAQRLAGTTWSIETVPAPEHSLELALARILQ